MRFRKGDKLIAMKIIYVIYCIVICFLSQGCDGIETRETVESDSESTNEELCKMIADGYCMVHCAHADSAYVCLESAKIQAESAEIPDSMVIGQIYNGLGLYYTELMADLPSGIDAFSTACRYVSGIPDAEYELCRYLFNIAMAYSIGNDVDTGLKYAEVAYKKGLELNDSLIVHDSSLAIAELKLRSGDILEGRRYIDTARRYQRKVGNYSRIMMLIAEGMADEIEGDNKGAELKYAAAADGIEAPIFLRLKSRLLLASLKSSEGVDKDAVDILNKGLRIAGRNKVKTYLSEIFTALAECHMRLGHQNAALNLMFYYKTYSDSMQTLMQETAMQRMRVNNEIMLNKFTIERQRGHIREKERDIFIVLSCGVLLAVALGFTLIMFYKKQLLCSVIVRQNKEYAKHEESLNRTIANLQSQTHCHRSNGAAMPAFKVEDIMTRLTGLLTEDSVITDSNLTLNSIAEMLDTNRTYLSKAIKDTTGDYFPALVRSLRVKRAIRMMEQNEDVSLIEIYEKSGFTSKSSFYSAFKHETGMSPSVYRNMLHKNDRNYKL